MLSSILACEDVAKSIRYYTEKLGFELAWEMPPNDEGTVEFACVKLAKAEILLGIIEGFVQKADIDKRGIGIQIYINLPESISIDALYEQATKSGADIIHPLETRDWGETVFTVNDIDGYNLMFAQESGS